MSTSRYILLPRGRIAVDPIADSLLKYVFDQANSRGVLRNPAYLPELPNRPLNLLDSVNETGPKLAEMDTETADAINRGTTPLRAEPEVIYSAPIPPGPGLATPSASAPGSLKPVVVHCEDSVSGAAIAGLDVVGYDNYAARTGDRGITDAAGNVTLSLAGPTIDRLYVRPNNTHWGAFRQGLSLPPFRVDLPLDVLSATYIDSIRAFYPTRKFNAATGVRVGILDTGVGPNTDLNVVFGRCTVTGQSSGNYQDVAEHGTHVAGLVGGNGGIGPATYGLAPGVDLYAFRVFDYYGGKLGASNYAILKAMILAAGQECDVINLSLGGGPHDRIVEEAIDDARNQGMLVVVAAGNDDRGSVSYPAAYAGATAISAMGRDGGFPAGSYFDGDVQRPPYGPDPLDFIASFSNVGPQVTCTGLGSGVLSTLPNNRFGPSSGTSMASPMVAGAAVSLLSNNPVVFGMPRDRARSNAIERLLQTNCVRRFGGGIWEGFGIPDPAAI